MKLDYQLDLIWAILNDRFPDLKVSCTYGCGTPTFDGCIDIASYFRVNWGEEINVQLIAKRVKEALEEARQFINCSLDKIKELEEKDAKRDSNGQEDE